MAEDMGDKTEAPTPRRRQEARDQGNVPRSPDLAAAVAVIASMVLLKYYGGVLVEALKAFMLEMLSTDSFHDFNPVNEGPRLLGSLLRVALAALPLTVGLTVVGLIVNVLQVGVQFNSNKLQPNFKALNPVKGLGSLFGKGRGFVPILLNLVKFAVIGFMAYTAVADRVQTIVGAQKLQFLQILHLACDVIYAIAIRIGSVLFILALVDYAFKWWKIEKELKMTKQQVEDEMKSMDGDPQIKARRRQLAMDRIRKQMKSAVPTADVIVTNPTHYAIALKYDANSMNAPRVVAKGKGPLALHIREIAIANGIPILERKPLARALYKLVEVGQEIPEQFYSTVAEILAYVWELSGKIKKAG